MTKRLESKYKISRRIGESLWGTAKDPVNKRNYAPGQHGMARKRKLGGYAQQLNEKQKLRGYYGNITERQFRKIYTEAARRKGDTSENLVGLLERRLDAVVYRLGIVPTVFASRQFVSHGHIQVNGKRVNVPSYMVKEGDEISVKESSKQKDIVVVSVGKKERSIPEYLEFDDKAVKGKFIRVPKLAEIPYAVQMQPNLVVEYYSR